MNGERMGVETRGGNRVDDYISRQATIDALLPLYQEHRYRIPGKAETYSEYNEAWQDALSRGESVIFNLPSVQPEPCKDAVSREEVIKLLCKETCHPGARCPDNYCVEVREKVNALPSAQPEPKKGTWIWHDYEDAYECSVCKTLWTFPDGTPEENGANYCPVCGANMGAEQK